MVIGVESNSVCNHTSDNKIYYEYDNKLCNKKFCDLAKKDFFRLVTNFLSSLRPKSLSASKNKTTIV